MSVCSIQVRINYTVKISRAPEGVRYKLLEGKKIAYGKPTYFSPSQLAGVLVNVVAPSVLVVQAMLTILNPGRAFVLAENGTVFTNQGKSFVGRGNRKSSLWGKNVSATVVSQSGIISKCLLSCAMNFQSPNQLYYHRNVYLLKKQISISIANQKLLGDVRL